MSRSNDSMTPSRPALARGASILVLSAFLALAACGGGPEGAAEAWLDALNKGDITRALELSTDETKALINLGNSLGENLAIGDYRIVKVNKISDTRAEVVVAAQDGESTLDLRKIDGQWKVGFKK
ncbi:MAG TPA: hypothetical protein VKZ85_08740 [Woeseiaceae bacterium]|nr:hypothetical protein [Woeseiaceae bacterium]